LVKNIGGIMKYCSFIDPNIFLFKRSIDISFSIIFLIVTLPLATIVAVLIKLSTPGPIFYCQLRVGKIDNDSVNYFHMIKFRTMVNDAEGSTGAVWAIANDNRLTCIGKFLRKTRLDELPQLINVIKGDMSLIGPRPERPEIVKTLANEIPFYSERTYQMLPGITGLAQVYQGYDTCIEDVKTKIGYDFSYSLSLTSLRTWLLMDCGIFFKTLMVMLLGRGQ